MYGASRPIRLMTLLPCTGTISVNRALARLERRRRKWLWPPFVRTTLPDPVMRNRLDVALWVFSLYFPAFCFCGTVNLLFTKLCGLLKSRITNNIFPSVEQYCTRIFRLGKSPPRNYYFFSFFGASIIVITRPSILGICSTTDTSSNSCAISFKSSRASSG